MRNARRARPEDRDRSLATVVAAFATDPLLRWVWPDDDRCAECGTAFFGLLLDLRLEGGEVWVVDDGDAVAMWNPPGGLYGVSPSGRWESLRGGFTDAERAKWDVTDSLLAVPKGTPPHWYLGVLATRPDRQGQGLGRAVVAPILAAADRIGVDSYLETAKETNLGFYRGRGFDVVVETQLPDGGPRCWLMKRSPEQVMVMDSLSRDVLVVVAAGPGLGAAVARRFAREGAAVGLVSRSSETLAQLADEAADTGAETSVATADVSDEQSLRTALRNVRDALGDPTALVYNGSEYLEGKPTEVAPEAMLHALRVGVTGAVVALQSVAPAMRAAGRGTVIFTGSVAADRPSVGAASVGVAKAGLRNLARSAHEELLPDGVHATTVTIKGVLRGPKALDLDAIADTYWALHTSPEGEWRPEVSFPR